LMSDMPVVGVLNGAQVVTPLSKTLNLLV